MRVLYEEYKMKITPLTPIHIGSGEVIMPGEYFMFRENGQHVLYAVDMGYLGSRLARGRDTICRWILDDPVGWVRTARENARFAELVRKYASFKARVSDTVADGIQQRWGQGVSNLEINTFQRSSGTPVVPGSSIKGALRTALLYRLADKPLEINFRYEGSRVAEWERSILDSKSKSIQDDLLRHLQISDCPVRDIQTEILDVEHVGMRTRSGKQAEIIDYRECLPGSLNGGDYTFETVLRISSGHPHYITSPGRLSKEMILEACREFYSEVIEAERQYWRDGREVIQLYDEIREKIKPADCAPIRIGWGCGMDSISLNLAKQTGRQGRGGFDPRFRYNPRTRRLFDGLYPPGWAVFTLERC